MWLPPEFLCAPRRRADWLRAALRVLAVCLAACVASPGIAEPGVLGGELGRWLDTEVLPQLGRALGEHPRFKGEKIRVVSLANGQPTESSTRLHQAVEAHVTQALLRDSSARIAWSDLPRRACSVSEPVVYLLGVEIERDGSRDHKVSIGVIDVAESEWVSGISHAWRGRLTRTERIAFSQPVDAPPTGSVSKPLPVTSAREIAKDLHDQLRCTQPEGLDGTVFIAPAESPALQRVVAALRAELATAPIAVLTQDQSQAEWMLSLVTQDVGRAGGARQLGLLLTRLNDRHSQYVATVYVDGMGRASGQALAKGPGAHALLSPLELSPQNSDGGICSATSSAERCAEVSFELLDDAYLFVLSTRDRTLSAMSCGAQLQTDLAGERRYRVRVAPGSTGLPGAGVYAIAVSDRSAARALASHIRSGVCDAPLKQPARWLEDLDALLEDQRGAVDWQAIHLTATAGRVERL